MGDNKTYMATNLVTPNKPLVFDKAVCNGCRYN